MFIEDRFHNSIEELLDWWILSEASSSSTTIRLIDGVARSVLEKVEQNEWTPRKLNLAMAKIRAKPDIDTLPQEISSTFRKLALETLSNYHCRYEPELDPKFVSFSFKQAERTVDELMKTQRLRKVLTSKHYERDQFAFRFTKSFGPAKIYSLDAHLYGRNSASPTLIDRFVIRDEQGDAADFSLAKILGFGFWKPCPNNRNASNEELRESFGEPLSLFGMLCYLLERRLTPS